MRSDQYHQATRWVVRGALQAKAIQAENGPEIFLQEHFLCQMETRLKGLARVARLIHPLPFENVIQGFPLGSGILVLAQDRPLGATREDLQLAILSAAWSSLVRKTLRWWFGELQQ